jgi:hypothetical protein
MATVKAVLASVSSLTMVSALRKVQLVPAQKAYFDLAMLSASALCPEVMAMLQNAPEELDAFDI